MPDLSLILAWSLFLAFILAMLALDLFVLHRKPHQLNFRQALIGTLVPMAVALLFVAIVYVAYEHNFINPLGTPDYTGHEAAVLFTTGYLVEISLSADNVFLFLLLMNFFAVPQHLQHRVLFWGVLGALFMRAAMIGCVGLLLTVHWVIYLFGAFLLFTALKMLFAGDAPPDPANSFPVKLAKKFLPLHPGYDGQKFFTRIHGKSYGTTLLLVLVCIEFTDLIFAVDSIPAIFGITRDTFIVFSSNVFAILGLRSMYFLLAGIMDKFHYLKIGLALVLAFVGAKMLLPALADLTSRFLTRQPHHWDIPPLLSLAIILTLLTVSILASFLLPKPPRPPHP